MHGGSITARSDGPGRGSEFVRASAGRPWGGVAIVGAPAGARPLASSLRILVVDDNRDAAASLGMLLRIMGQEVRTAHDGLEAVKLADEFRPQVVLLDIGLPGLSGHEAAQRIRQEPWGATWC